MTIIQFKPSSWQGNKALFAEREDAYLTHVKSHHYKPDRYEFVDYEIRDEENQGFFGKLNNLFGKSPETKNSMTEEFAYQKANNVLCDTIIKRNQISAVLDAVTSEDAKTYLWDFYNAGIEIAFEEDNLGRGVMLEKDLKGNLQRATTFIKSTHELVKIEEAATKGKGINRISFFDYEGKNFEVRKNMTSEKTMKEFYSFENGEPLSYKRGDCRQTNSGIVAKEEYIF